MSATECLWAGLACIVLVVAHRPLADSIDSMSFQLFGLPVSRGIAIGRAVLVASSRLDVAENALHRDRVDLLAVAAEEAARVGAHVDGSRGIVVDGDERLLRRALRNLVENGQRYGGGDLDVVLARDDAAPGGSVVKVQVCDRGPGVPAAMRERIFEPFFRLPGHAEQAGGVGLGLALVKQIAVRHVGNVRCEARAGGGSVFVIEMPAS